MTTPLFKRTAIDQIALYMKTDDVIVIHGARQVGKTSILKYLQAQLDTHGERTFYIDLEDSRFVNLLDTGVDEFVRYLAEIGFDLKQIASMGRRVHVFLDEIQYLANPSAFLKLIADHHRALKLIVSGASSFEMKSKFKNSLVGRTIDFTIYPLSFREFLVFKEIPFPAAGPVTPPTREELRRLFKEFVLYGGYPKIVLTPDVFRKERYLQQIVDTYIRKDIRDLAEIRDVRKFNRLVEILASQSGSLLHIAELSNTCALARETVERYLFLLEQTYILKLVRPFSRNLRSEISKTPKVFFYDTGLLQLLWLKRLQNEILGQVLETAIFVKLVKKHGVHQVNYWRTKDGNEIDFILNLPDGLQAIEVNRTFPTTAPRRHKTFEEAYLRPAPDDSTRSSVRLVALEGTPAGEKSIAPWDL